MGQENAVETQDPNQEEAQTPKERRRPNQQKTDAEERQRTYLRPASSRPGTPRGQEERTLQRPAGRWVKTPATSLEGHGYRRKSITVPSQVEKRHLVHTLFEDF
ncbi:hypothetical protein NDU88_004231 [Pleurodeles waltl]|uniref:Uncharacterized protein n=1 Tax=Pleurodeles waltl TaxID=8319 RepID=A0AAV7T784_PLEWA|nr:hypothetical protein NDU88_004231 [Pleurodeles waltl]